MSRKKEISGMERAYNEWEKKACLCLALSSLWKSHKSKIRLDNFFFSMIEARQDECWLALHFQKWLKENPM